MMCVVKDSMVLIHLAKISILEQCCKYFGEVLIPELVYEETVKGKEKHEDSLVIKNFIDSNLIKVIKIKNGSLIKKANLFNIQGGEAECVALYWQEKADLLATDDDNFRRKKDILKLNLVGTPAIILNLYKKNKINKTETLHSLRDLKKFGWFHNAVLDKVEEEVK
ncbi:hypothetical protein HY837_07015 [archaeon]|nr:hypothetical protein [archaeon]